MRYYIYAELAGMEPRMWREFEIDGAESMADLSFAVMSMFKATGEHLFAMNVYQPMEVSIVRKHFTQKHYKKFFSRKHRSEAIDWELSENNQEPDWPFGSMFSYREKRNLNSESIHEALEVGHLFSLEYDFGDSWEIIMQVKKVLEEDTYSQPQIVAGEGYGIVEDIGGVSALRLLDAVFKGEAEEYRDYFSNFIDFADVEYDDRDVDFTEVIASLEEFSIEECNALLQFDVKSLAKKYKHRL